MKNVLEKQKHFSLIAWVLIIGFILFTYFLVVQLQAEIKKMQIQRDATESANNRDLRFGPIKY